MGVCISKITQPQAEITIDPMPVVQPQKGNYSMNSLPAEPRRGDKKRQAKIEVIEEQIHENVVKQAKEKSPFEFQMILNAFGNHFMFAQLDNNDKAKLIDDMGTKQHYFLQMVELHNQQVRKGRLQNNHKS